MASTKPWKQTLVTPVGVASYPYLNKPDSKFGDPQFKVTLRFEGEEGATLMAKLEELAEEALAYQKENDPAYKKIKSLSIPMSLATDEDGNDIEGVYEFKAKSYAFFTDKKTGKTTANELTIVDSAKNPTDAIVRAGSKLKLMVGLSPYTVQGGGISARINAVQVLELVSGSNLSGFDVEDGYTATPSTTQGADDSSEDEDEF